jgi:hypothetical protein
VEIPGNFFEIFLFAYIVVVSFATIIAFKLSFDIFLFRPFYLIFQDRKEIKKLCKEAVQFYGKELGLKNKPKIKVKVELPYIFTGLHGYIEPDGENAFTIILMLNFNKYNILKTLAHEMVHLHQFNRGDLKKKGNKIFWKNEDITHVPYKDREFEAEAFGKERDLAIAFFEHKKINKGFRYKVYLFTSLLAKRVFEN